MIPIIQNVESRLQPKRLCSFICLSCVFMALLTIQHFRRTFQDSSSDNIFLLKYSALISSHGELADSEKKWSHISKENISITTENNTATSHENIYTKRKNLSSTEIAMDVSSRTSARMMPKYKGTILIHATWRGGSTFVSDFFNKHRSIAYMYEPLKTASDAVAEDEHYIKGVLDSILHCRFHDTEGLKDVDKNWYHSQVFCQLPSQTPGCHMESGKMYMSFEDAEMYCRSMPYKAYKFIRLPSIEILANYTQQGAKVIQLLRDPRGIYTSVFKMNNYKRNMKRYCDSIVADLLYARKEYGLGHKEFMHNYHVIRYEDLALNPLKEMYELYKFLEIQPDQEVKRWASNQQNLSKSGRRLHHPDQSKSYTYGTTRSNPAFTAQAWRQTLSWIENEDIQNHCAEFLDIFGYSVFHNRTDLRKLDNYTIKPMLITNWLKIQTNRTRDGGY